MGQRLQVFQCGLGARLSGVELSAGAEAWVRYAALVDLDPPARGVRRARDIDRTGRPDEGRQASIDGESECFLVQPAPNAGRARNGAFEGPQMAYDALGDDGGCRRPGPAPGHLGVGVFRARLVLAPRDRQCKGREYDR